MQKIILLAMLLMLSACVTTESHNDKPKKIIVKHSLSQFSHVKTIDEFIDTLAKQYGPDHIISVSPNQIAITGIQGFTNFYPIDRSLRILCNRDAPGGFARDSSQAKQYLLGNGGFLLPVTTWLDKSLADFEKYYQPIADKRQRRLIGVKNYPPSYCTDYPRAVLTVPFSWNVVGEFSEKNQKTTDAILFITKAPYYAPFIAEVKANYDAQTMRNQDKSRHIEKEAELEKQRKEKNRKQKYSLKNHLKKVGQQKGIKICRYIQQRIGEGYNSSLRDVVVTGYIEGYSAKKIQIRVADMRFVIPKSYDNPITDGADIDGILIKPGQVIWDDVATWEVCKK